MTEEGGRFYNLRIVCSRTGQHRSGKERLLAAGIDDLGNLKFGPDARHDILSESLEPEFSLFSPGAAGHYLLDLNPDKPMGEESPVEASVLFSCKWCGDQLKIRAGRLVQVASLMETHGETKVSLSGLRYILSGSPGLRS